MATLKQKIQAEQSGRAMLEKGGLPPPDAVEYGYTCIRLIFEEPKLCVVVDIDEPPDGFKPWPAATDGAEPWPAATDMAEPWPAASDDLDPAA